MHNEDFFSNALVAIDQIEAETEPRRIVEEFSKFVRTFGFNSVAVSEVTNPVIKKNSDFIRFSNWPKEWAQYWVENRLIIVDPIAKMSLRRQTTFSWSEAYDTRFPFAKEAKNLFRDFGFNDGIAIPIRTGTGLPGCVSLGGSNYDRSPRAIRTIELVAIHCYAQLESVIEVGGCSENCRPLTPRESEILHFVAAGKTNWEIGKILSLSEYYVRDCVKAVCKKLDAASRTHAVTNAIRNRLIYP